MQAYVIIFRQCEFGCSLPDKADPYLERCSLFQRLRLPESCPKVAFRYLNTSENGLEAQQLVRVVFANLSPP